MNAMKATKTTKTMKTTFSAVIVCMCSPFVSDRIHYFGCVRGIILRRNISKEGAGSTHSECYFVTVHFAMSEGSAHSGCCFATGHLAMSEGSAHWEGYFAEAIEGWVKAARIRSITLPQHIGEG